MAKEILGQPIGLDYALRGKLLFHLKQRCTQKQIRVTNPSFHCSWVQTTSSSHHHDELKKMVQQVHQAPTLITKEDNVLSAGRSKPVPTTVTVTGNVSLRCSKSSIEKEIMTKVIQGFDDAFNNMNGGSRGILDPIVLQLVSTEIDPKTREAKRSKNSVLEWLKDLKDGSSETTTYKVEFEIDSDFGLPGAISVINKSEKELFLEDIVIEDIINFTCNSWVQPDRIHPEERIFFTNKVYLPSETPRGVREVREEELRKIRGDGKGVRKGSERVYDFDLYNDLGNPDKGKDHQRPIFGGDQLYPYPRRCRTGRPSSITDKRAESRVSSFNETYVPRDEAFDEHRLEALDVERTKGITRNLIPFFRTCVTKCGSFKKLSDCTSIYNNKNNNQEIKSDDDTKNSDKIKGTNNIINNIPSDFSSMIQDSLDDYFKFSTPNIIRGNSCFCIRDEELGRQTLAGINPLSIKRLESFPPVSALDPSIYGSQVESALKDDHLLPHLQGMSVQQALAEKKLYILDYHDTYLPFLKGINSEEEDRKAYATRTIFLLTQIGTLKPIAIELSLPEGSEEDRASKQVLSPPLDSKSYWLWELAKAHVCSNDSGAHQLVHHWLRTHACMEPFIIAAHRRMSVMHPIMKLLKPHMKDTLQINALAREALINGGGIIESDFTSGKYSVEIVSAAYRDWWRFDMESLPADLIRRGLAEPDPTQPHGLKLLVEDYPYANDGLPIWFAIENWVRSYVTYYYRDGSTVQSDTELQAWYNEAINVGHADHRHATWWPKLSSPSDLTSLLTTLIWIASVQHSAVNFGQYPYGGYVPMRPPLMRKLLPKEGDEGFMKDPEGYLLGSMPNLFQTTKFLTVVNMLSQHSESEEYLGQRKDLKDWCGDNEIIEGFYRFSMEVKRIEKEIEKRNKDPNLRNRCGPGIPPYELLMASSSPGVTCRGVPNSISI